MNTQAKHHSFLESLQARVRAPGCSLHLLLKIIPTIGWLTGEQWWVFLPISHIFSFVVFFVVISWPVKMSPCGSCDPLFQAHGAPCFLAWFRWPGLQPSQREGRLFQDKGHDATLLANAPTASAHGLPARFGNGQGTVLPGPAGSLCDLRQSCEGWQARPSLQRAHTAEHGARTARSCFHVLWLPWFSTLL